MTGLSLAKVGVVLLLMGLLGAVPAVQAQTADDALRFTRRAPAYGARMTGLAGAGTAGLEDYSAFLYNPAALAYFPHSEVAGAFNALSATDESSFQAPSGTSSPFDEDVRDYGIGNLAYVYKVPADRGSLVIGAALNQVRSYERVLSFEGKNVENSITQTYLPFPEDVQDIEVEPLPGGGFRYTPFFSNAFRNSLSFVAYELFATDIDPSQIRVNSEGEVVDSLTALVPFRAAVAPRTTVRQSGTVTKEGGLREASIGGAVEAANNVMVGASLGVSFGTYRLVDNYQEEAVLNGNEGNFDFFGIRSSFESNLVGVNARVGLSYEPASGLRAGLMLESPTYYSVTEDFSTELEVQFADGLVNENYGEIYGDELGENIGSGEEFEYQITTPWRLGAGLAYSIGAATVSGDLEFVDWTQLELDRESDPQYFESENSLIKQNIGYVFNTRVGAEYRFGSLALRGGLALKPDPYEVGLTGVDGEDLDTSHLFYSAGLGYRFSERLQLDVAWMQERYDDRYTPYLDPDIDSPPLVDEEVVRNRFVLGVRYAF